MNTVDCGLVFDSASAASYERCNAFTSLICLSDGSLICGFKSGPEKLCPTDRMILMKSDDQGKNWRRLFDGFDTEFNGVPGSFSGGYLVEIEPGRLLISLHWIDRSNPSLPLSNPVTSGVLPMKYLISESVDTGRLWTPLREVGLSPHPGASPTGAIHQLGNGQLMLAYESWKEWDAVDGDQSANVKLSDDGGSTWGEPITIASDLTKRLYYWDNRIIRQPNTNRLLAAYWTHDSGRGVDMPIHLGWGSADGKCWGRPRETAIHGQVAAPLFLDEDHLLLVYVHRHDPPSIRAVISEDRGCTWKLEDEIVIYRSGATAQAGMDRSRGEAEYWDDMVRWTFGHPKAVLMGDGSVFVVYYAPPLSSDRAFDGSEVSTATPALNIHWARLN